MAFVSKFSPVFPRVVFLLFAMSMARLADGAAVAVVEQPAGHPAFSVTEAQFGARLNCDGVTGEIAEALVDVKVLPSYTACTPMLVPVDGKILLVERGTCSFDTKAWNAQNAGAAAIIVVNNQPGPAIIMAPTPGGPKITIPAVMLSQQDGAALRAIQGTPRVVRLRATPCDPARVVATRMPDGMLQVSGAGAGSTDQFVIANFGDDPTTVSLTGSGSFFAFEPSTATLPSRGSRTISIIAPPAAQGTYGGSIAVSGADVPGGTLEIPVRLAVESPPAATPGAVPAIPRVDVVGTERMQGANVTFTNSGEGTVRGLLVGDAPWLLTPEERVEIPPGASRSFPFSVDRALRVEKGPASGSSRARLRLVHLDVEASSIGRSTFDDGSLVTPVSVVDTARPEVTATVVPPLGNDEVAIFVPGVGPSISNISIVNAARTAAVDDLRVFHASEGEEAQSIARPLQGLEALNLSNVVANVFDRDVEPGTIQIRSASSSRLGVSASLTNETSAGVFGTALPAFRSDRSIRAFESATLAGIANDADARTTLYVQETSGLPSTYRIEFFDEAGAMLGHVEDAIEAFALSVVSEDHVPEGAVSAVVANQGSGRLASYAMLTDRASGDSWIVTDWNRFYGIPYFGRQTIVPVAGAVSGRNGTHFRSDLVVTNVGNTEAPVTLEYWPASAGSPISRSVDLAAGESRVMRDVVTTLFEVSAPSVGSILVRPGGGSTTATSRTYTTAPFDGGTFGTGVPVVPYTVALAPGASRTFSGLADSTLATTEAGTGGTFRTNVGLLEVQGGTTSVRVSLLFSDGSPVSAEQVRASRRYTLAPYEFRQLNAIAAELLGPELREGSYGNLDNLVLRIENASNGTGWVLPFVTQTDNGTGDTMLRVE